LSEGVTVRLGRRLWRRRFALAAGLIVLVGLILFLLSIPAYGRVEPEVAQAISGGVAALLTVSALFAANRALEASEQHFDIEQRPLLAPLRPEDHSEEPLRVVPMAPQPVKVAPTGVYIERLSDGPTTWLAFSIPYRNIGKGIARVARFRIHPRNVHQYDGLSRDLEVEHVLLAGESEGRTWFNIRREDAAEWVFDVIERGRRPVLDQGRQARLDIDVLYTDVRRRNPQVTRLLVRPRLGSTFASERSDDQAAWYAEGARYYEGDINPPVQSAPTDQERADRERAQTGPTTFE
jgi:hypothetical protein